MKKNTMQHRLSCSWVSDEIIVSSSFCSRGHGEPWTPWTIQNESHWLGHWPFLSFLPLFVCGCEREWFMFRFQVSLSSTQSPHAPFSRLQIWGGSTSPRGRGKRRASLSRRGVAVFQTRGKGGPSPRVRTSLSLQSAWLEEPFPSWKGEGTLSGVPSSSFAGKRMK